MLTCRCSSFFRASVCPSQQIYENVYALDASNNVIAAPIDVSKDQVYLVIYATGIRRAPKSQVTVSIGGVNAPVSYAGAQGFYTGLDQVNVQLPASLAGRGDVPVALSIGTNHANTENQAGRGGEFQNLTITSMAN